jgi:hypothetical protein
MKRVSFAAATLAGIVCSSAVHALPVTTGLPAAGSPVVLVNGCHRSCEWGPGRGWHRHGAACYPIRCVPRAANPGRCFVDRSGIRRCRW